MSVSIMVKHHAVAMYNCKTQTATICTISLEENKDTLIRAVSNSNIIMIMI